MISPTTVKFLPFLSLLFHQQSPFVQAINERLFVSVNSLLVDTRLDPIVNPGSCSSHVHSVYGNAEFDAKINRNDVTDDNWRDDTDKIDQTTSNVIPNLSMYWAPSLYIFNPEDNLYYLVPSFSRAYYRIRYKHDRSEINPFPSFLRIVVGNATRKTPWTATDGSEPGHDHIKWTNRTEDRQTTDWTTDGDWTNLKAASADDIGRMRQLEMNIDFPNCLSVKRNGSPRIRANNHRSHASYSKPNDATACPDDYPYRIPILNLEVRYKLNEMRAILDSSVVNNVDNWFLSTNDKSGAGAHADFVSGWPEEMFQQILDFCDDGGDLKNVPDGSCPLIPYQGLSRNEMESKVVPYTKSLPNEVVGPAVAQLPSGPCPSRRKLRGVGDLKGN